MARLFIRHKPVESDILPGFEENRFIMRAEFLPANGISLDNADMDFVYVCIVHNGKCWAARQFIFNDSSVLARIVCVPFNDDPSGQEMLLADMILA